MRRTKAPDIGELLDSIASLGGIDIHPAGCRSMARALNRPCLCLSGREALAFPSKFYFKEPDGSHWWTRMELLLEDLHLAQPGSYCMHYQYVTDPERIVRLLNATAFGQS